MQKLKEDCDKRLFKLKKAAEIQMRNVKIMARDRAKKLIEEALVRAKRQFKGEMLNMLVEFDAMRDLVVKKDNDLVKVQALLIEQEKEVTLRNTRTVADVVLECDDEQVIAELEELETPVETILGTGKRELKVDNSQLSLHDRLEMDSEKTRRGDKNYTLPKRF